MSSKDYYQVMGLAQDASPKDIKSAYRRLARKYHPDLNKGPNAEAQFKELGEAYEVLKDPAKRRAYDQRGRETHAAHQQRYRPDVAGDYAFYTGAEGGVEDDLFASLFGGRGRRASHAPMPGADVQATLHVSLEEAYHGVVKSIRVPSAGSEGTQLKVNIPAEIKSGQPIRLAGQGEASPLGGPKGDLYLTIVVDKHPLFDVMGDDIYLTLPIAPWEAALGITIKVPTLAGPVGLKIPPGSQGGQTLRLKARGLRGKTHGDQYVLLKIMIPTPKTDADKAFYQQMAKDMPFDPRERWGGLNG